MDLGLSSQAWKGMHNYGKKGGRQDVEDAVSKPASRGQHVSAGEAKTTGPASDSSQPEGWISHSAVRHRAQAGRLGPAGSRGLVRRDAKVSSSAGPGGPGDERAATRPPPPAGPAPAPGFHPRLQRLGDGSPAPSPFTLPALGPGRLPLPPQAARPARQPALPAGPGLPRPLRATTRRGRPLGHGAPGHRSRPPRGSPEPHGNMRPSLAARRPPSAHCLRGAGGPRARPRGGPEGSGPEGSGPGGGAEGAGRRKPGRGR
ncbi:proline-rich protein 2-like [Falco cherrug]|uniref:proline-rich protein 2-like n=1 Tax=Falco cherrug TaxID=345164 RepID=UPI00247863B0|nr:proline-rich protein 2-like [Falco cherrug]